MKLEWANVAKLEPGQPLFRAVDQRQNIGAASLISENGVASSYRLAHLNPRHHIGTTGRAAL